jgi:hypothetical protein
MARNNDFNKAITGLFLAVFFVLGTAAATWGVASAHLAPNGAATPGQPGSRDDVAANDTDSPGLQHPVPPARISSVCTLSLTGSITTADPVQTGRVFRDGIADACGIVDDSCVVGVTTGARHYDIYTYVAQANTCVTVDLNALACTGVNFLYSTAYIGAFDPANICVNHTASSGDSPNPQIAYSFEVLAGQTFSVVVHELNPDAGCSQYQISITGDICPNSTPSTTATRTNTPTRTATPTSSSTRTSTPTSTPTGTTRALVGHVTWQGLPAQPSPLQQQPISLTLLSGSTVLADYPIRLTDPSGFFTVTTTLPNGTYTWRAKGALFLGKSSSLTLVGGPTIQVEMGTMQAGDLSADNVVDVLDFNIIKGNFGMVGSGPEAREPDK